MAIELVKKNGNVDLTAPKITGAVKSVNGMKGDVVLTAADVGAVQDTFDSYLYGDGKWMLGINKEGKVQPTQSYSAPTLDGGSIEGFVAYDKAQDLTDEQRKQARDNIAQYKYNFIETKYSIMKSYIADYSEYISPVSKIDMELANSITGLASASFSSLATISFNLKSLATSPKNEGTIKNIIAEYENMKANGCLGNNYCYFAIGDGKGNAIAKIIINLSNASGYTHNIQFSESDEGYTGTIKWDNNTQTVYQNGVTRKYIDATLTKENYYADAKAVGDRLDNIVLPDGDVERVSRGVSRLITTLIDQSGLVFSFREYNNLDDFFDGLNKDVFAIWSNNAQTQLSDSEHTKYGVSGQLYSFVNGEFITNYIVTLKKNYIYIRLNGALVAFDSIDTMQSFIASGLKYNNTASGLAATTLQGAVDELGATVNALKAQLDAIVDGEGVSY